MNRFGKAFLGACIGVLIAGVTVCVGASDGPPAFPSAPPSPAAPAAAPSALVGGETPPSPAPEKESEAPDGEANPVKTEEPAAPAENADEKSIARKNLSGRYSVILVRNPFGLNPPPPPEQPPPPPPPEPDIDIKLTGMTTLLGQQRAFLKTIDPTKKEKNETYYSLKVGESKDGLEIVSIDMDAGTVTIRHKDVEKELNMKEDGLKPKVVANVANLTPAQRQQQAILDAKNKQAALLAARQRQLPPGMSTSTSRPGNRVTPTSLPSATRTSNGYNRTTIRPPTISSPSTRSVRPNGVQQLPTATRNLPLPSAFERPIRSNNGPLLPPPPVIDTVQQELQIEVNREVNKIAEERDGLVFPPLPPTTQR